MKYGLIESPLPKLPVPFDRWISNAERIVFIPGENYEISF